MFFLNARFTLMFGLTVLLVSQSAYSQPRYASRAEIEGAAATGPRLSEAVLSNVALFCAQLGPDTERLAFHSVGRWRDRHRDFLAISEHYRSAMEAAAKNMPKTERDSVMEFLVADYKDLVNILSKNEIVPLQSARMISRPTAIRMCESYFAGVDAGRHDISSRDPELASFLNDKVKIILRARDNAQ